jgi:hypothetical protein
VASPREIEDFRKDAGRWRLVMRQLLAYDRDALSDEMVDLIERLAPLTHVEEISYRQAEWLLDVRDKVRIVPTYRQFSLKALVKACHQNRFDLGEADQDWIEQLVESGRGEFRFYEARRIYRLARRLGEVDQDDAAA